MGHMICVCDLGGGHSEQQNKEEELRERNTKISLLTSGWPLCNWPRSSLWWLLQGSCRSQRDIILLEICAHVSSLSRTLSFLLFYSLKMFTSCSLLQCMCVVLCETGKYGQTVNMKIPHIFSIFCFIFFCIKPFFKHRCTPKLFFVILIPLY